MSLRTLLLAALIWHANLVCLYVQPAKNIRYYFNRFYIQSAKNKTDYFNSLWEFMEC